MMHSNILRAITRRHFFRQSGFGIGGLALSSLLDDRLFAQQGRRTARAAARRTSRPKRRTSSICSWPGAPTQLDLFDNKPALQKHDGQEIPAEFIPEGGAVRVHQGHAAAPRFAVQVQEDTANPAPSCPSCCRTWRPSPTTSPSSARCTRRSSTTRPASSS